MKTLLIALEEWELDQLYTIAAKITPDGDELVPVEIAASYALRIGLSQILREAKRWHTE